VNHLEPSNLVLLVDQSTPIFQAYHASLTVSWLSWKNWGIDTEWLSGENRPSIQASSHLYLSHNRVARDTRFERLRCSHTGTYADDCLVQRVTAHKCYIVATCDRELRRRIRQIPGVPLMYIVKRRYAIERLPDQGAPS
jgi:hypothetical protein